MPLTPFILRPSLRPAALVLLLTLAGPATAAQTLALTALTKNKASAFNETSLTARAGEEVTVTIQNDSEGEKEFRNWVLAKPGTEGQVMDSAMAAAAAKQWSPSSPDVIAKSGMIAPGASETVTFRAPSTPGEYPYFCTFPGHFMNMRGKLIVKMAAAAPAPKR